jgi:tetratricopeptide (TPR) repeat protein
MSKKILQVCVNTLLLLILLTFGLSGQNIKRGYKLLEKADYEKSWGLFKDAVSENSQNPAGLFGLALILADTNSSYYNLIGAWEYASKLKPNIERLTPEELEFIGEYFLNTETRHINRPVKKKIEYAIETIEAKLIKYIREENNLDIVYKVIDKFPEFRYYENVIHIRNQLEFRKYEKQNKLEGYLEFIKKFPEAAQIEKAVRYRDKLAFDNACLINTVEAYRGFMKMYPEASENNMAIKKLYAVAFQKAKQVNTIQAFDEFMTEYPDALEISDAKLIQKQLLYEYAKKIQTLQAYNEFIRKYPEGQQYIDIFNLKSLDNGMHFISAHPLPSNNTLWARSFEEEENEELTACMTVDTLNSYIVGGTVFRSDTGSTDVWIIKINQDGKMVWNKYVGEEFNDEVNLLAINNKNEILGAGYTWMSADSSSRESWLFKLGQDGQKLWSKKFGKLHIKTLLVTHAGTIFLGGFLLNDSLGSKYSVVVLNENGKRLWGRTYTGNGEIVQISECPDQNILIAGNRWRAKIDPKGYLVWESSFNASDSIIASQVLPKGEICYLGYRSSNKLVLIKTGSDNKIVFEREMAIPEIPVQVNTFIRGGLNQIIALFTYEQYQSLHLINTLNGELLTSSHIPFEIKVAGIVTDRKNNLLVIACNGEIIVIKNNGLAF